MVMVALSDADDETRCGSTAEGTQATEELTLSWIMFAADTL